MPKGQVEICIWNADKRLALEKGLGETWGEDIAVLGGGDLFMYQGEQWVWGWLSALFAEEEEQHMLCWGWEWARETGREQEGQTQRQEGGSASYEPFLTAAQSLGKLPKAHMLTMSDCVCVCVCVCV